MGGGIGSQIEIGPRLQALICALEQPHVLRIIAPHCGPGFWVSFDATTPESGPCIRHLAATAEIPPDIIELIAVEFEFFACYLKGVNGLKGTWWREAIDDKTSPDFLYVEGIAVMRDDYIRLIKNLPQVSAEMRVACFTGLVRWVVREAIRFDRLAVAACGKPQQKGIAFDPDDILDVSERPNAG